LPSKSSQFVENQTSESRGNTIDSVNDTIGRVNESIFRRRSKCGKIFCEYGSLSSSAGGFLIVEILYEIGKNAIGQPPKEKASFDDLSTTFRKDIVNFDV
jgi:hypothetical protein